MVGGLDAEWPSQTYKLTLGVLLDVLCSTRRLVQFITLLSEAISALCEHTHRITVVCVRPIVRWSDLLSRSACDGGCASGSRQSAFDLRDWILDADVTVRYTTDVTEHGA